MQLKQFIEESIYLNAYVKNEARLKINGIGTHFTSVSSCVLGGYWVAGGQE